MRTNVKPRASTTAGGDEAEHAADRRGLAGSVRTEEPEDAALRHLEVQLVESDGR
jgi:hypothetical protein